MTTGEMDPDNDFPDIPLSDACWLALVVDALIVSRGLFEPCELARSPSGVRPILIWPDWASMVLATFAKTKVARLPGRNPATPKFNWHYMERLVLQ